LLHQSLLSSVGLERLTVIVRLSSEGPLFDSERGDLLFAHFFSFTISMSFDLGKASLAFVLVTVL
jgi:hypothetical protein